MNNFNFKAQKIGEYTYLLVIDKCVLTNTEKESCVNYVKVRGNTINNFFCTVDGYLIIEFNCKDICVHRTHLGRIKKQVEERIESYRKTRLTDNTLRFSTFYYKHTGERINLSIRDISHSFNNSCTALSKLYKIKSGRQISINTTDKTEMDLFNLLTTIDEELCLSYGIQKEEN